MSIKFFESKNPNYPARTIYNCTNSDITLAIAYDFNTRGEILTKSVAGKKWIGLNLGCELNQIRIETLAFKLNSIGKDFILNIAGNGAYGSNSPSQEEMDIFVLNLLKFVIPLLKFRIIKILSGGQSGIDESSIKVSIEL